MIFIHLELVVLILYYCSIIDNTKLHISVWSSDCGGAFMIWIINSWLSINIVKANAIKINILIKKILLMFLILYFLPCLSLDEEWAWWGDRPGGGGWRWFCWSMCCLLPSTLQPPALPDLLAPPSLLSWTLSWYHWSSLEEENCWSCRSLISQSCLFQGWRAESVLLIDLKHFN